MKTAFIVFLLVGASGCVDFKCYSNIAYARKAAEEFCSQANANQNLCESLKIYGKNVCKFAKSPSDKCKSLGDTLQTFARILYPDCNGLDEKICRSKESCGWTFKNPLLGKYADL